MVTCRECVYFTPPAEWEYPEFKRKYGECQLAETEDGKPVAPDPAAFALDAERYHGHLRVLPEFGCNQGQKR